MSDALGRKRVLWIGFAIYVLAALGAALAPSLAVLLFLRFLAGVGAAAIRIVTLGAVRDRYRGDQMASILSYILAIFLLVPMVAPSIGAIVVAVGQRDDARDARLASEIDRMAAAAPAHIDS